MSINVGDMVARKSYGEDIIFVVDKIIETSQKDFAILKGLTIRITADAPIDDLKHVNKDKIENSVNNIDEIIKQRVKTFEAELLKRKIENKEIFYTGKILHLDAVCIIIYKIIFM